MRLHLWHRWKVRRDTCKTVYEECVSCGKRRVWQHPGGHQPIDQHWVNGIKNEFAARGYELRDGVPFRRHMPPVKFVEATLIEADFALKTNCGEDMIRETRNEIASARNAMERISGDMVKLYHALEGIYEKHGGDGCLVCMGLDFVLSDVGSMHHIESNVPRKHAATVTGVPPPAPWPDPPDRSASQ